MCWTVVGKQDRPQEIQLVANKYAIAQYSSDPSVNRFDGGEKEDFLAQATKH